MSVLKGGYQNRLLANLQSADLALLEPHLVPVVLRAHSFIEISEKPILYAYFLESGLGSIVGRIKRLNVEVGMLGWEGMSGSALLLGDDIFPVHLSTIMRMDGHGFRIAAEDLREASNKSLSLHHFLLRYCNKLNMQISLTAVANSQCSVSERVARWLVMVHDRIEGDQFPITHDRLADALGVRRPGVTVAFHELEGERLIRCQRGTVIIVDREGLEARCQGVYSE